MDIIGKRTKYGNRTKKKNMTMAIWNVQSVAAVSYTHLDVYKRQVLDSVQCLPAVDTTEKT